MKIRFQMVKKSRGRGVMGTAERKQDEGGMETGLAGSGGRSYSDRVIKEGRRQIKEFPSLTRRDNIGR